MILCFGCSFTEHTKVSFNDPSIDTDFIRWPKIIGKELNINSYNLGQSGLSNDVIAHWIKREIIHQKNKVKLVLVLWTDWYRFAFLSHMSFSYMMSSLDPEWLDTVYNKDNKYHMPHLPDDWIGQMEYENEYLKKIREFMNYRYKFGVREFNNKKIASHALLEHHLITNYFSIQKFCESYKIPIIHAQGVACTPMNIKTEKYLMNTSYTEYVDRLKDKYLNLFHDNFIGWPLFPQFGGFHLADKITAKNLFISNTDQHPNAEGHELIANHFIDKIKRLKIF
tara:strand:+ start:1076 stop:1918 length:843 start_codon:yes stop_codon:yes gene_type:complete